MIKHENGNTTITCDKCGKSDDAPSGSYNEYFSLLNWTLNKGRKYMHLCWNCLPAKSKKARNFVKEHFGI